MLTFGSGAFAISRITDVVWNTNMFDSLVLDKEQRDFVHDLVQTHSSKDENSFDDFVTHKGKGLIGLLAGPPGVGKTLTAEAVAEVTKRPLYMISSGELGSIPSAIHDRLVKVMELAELWDAVLLLDEADVFLTERDDTNLTRNAIASIFLRELEYYQGILILTTNRIKVFDPAFQSRIHFCLQYENLTPTGRAAIWRSFITRAKATTNLKVDISDDDITKLALEENVNGRQIKNIMSVSQAVAVRRKQVLDLASIRTAAKLSQNFDVKPLALVSRKSWGL
jgi:SpoVK/Ycf46/Vps4 family AAA+-type ATPase